MYALKTLIIIEISAHTGMRKLRVNSFKPKDLKQTFKLIHWTIYMLYENCDLKHIKRDPTGTKPFKVFSDATFKV